LTESPLLEKCNEDLNFEFKLTSCKGMGIGIMSPLDIAILTNGPGEIATWVRPVVKALRQTLGVDSSQVRISVILSPCPHSTGQESAIAKSYPEVDRVQSASHFFPFLLWGQTAENWHWRKQGIVIFLGGDQFYTLLIGKRLGYRTLVYAEWDARWYRYLDAFAVMNSHVLKSIPTRYHYKFSVVGDLIADLVLEVENRLQTDPNTVLTIAKTARSLIGLLPGSKPAKLMQGVPLCLAIAEKLQALQPNVEFIVPVAPTLELDTLASYAQLKNNSLISQLGGVTGELVRSTTEGVNPSLITSGGTKITLITEFPAYHHLLSCQLCVTTVGANTAELGSLGIPMIVLLPTQQLDAMRSWDGIPGILANLPVLGTSFAKLINTLVIRQKRLFAWPNIWAKQAIVPELVGQLNPQDIAVTIVDYLTHPDRLQTMSDRLIAVRGKYGAAQQIASLVWQQLII
jgi:lipid A disaccharide synthetase